MIPFYLNELSSVLNSQLIGYNCIITSISTDSRLIKKNNTLFIALKGNNFDAHNFISDAINFGAKALIVNCYLSINIPYFVVQDTRKALGLLSHWIRKKSNAKFIAITGSSGKTTVKDMTANILKNIGNVLSTEKNFNNDIGVPKTLLRLNKKHNFAVIELGTSKFGDINWTTNLVKPDIALINNLHISHLLGLNSIKGISKEKSDIFNGLISYGLAIINANSNDLSRWKKKIGLSKIQYFSLYFKEKSNFYADKIFFKRNHFKFLLHSPIGEKMINLPLIGKHNVSNALAASSISISLGASLEDVERGLSKINAIPGRLYPIKLNKKKFIIDDSYNANIGSMIAAIDTLSNMCGYKVMVIGDMAELGKDAILYHSIIGKIINHYNINLILSIGNLSKFITKFSNFGKHFTNKNYLIDNIIKLILNNDSITILIKGSRIALMEDIIFKIKEKFLC